MEGTLSVGWQSRWIRGVVVLEVVRRRRDQWFVVGFEADGGWARVWIWLIGWERMAGLWSRGM